MPVNKKLKGFYMGFFDCIETWCANRISNFIERRTLERYCSKRSIPKDLRKSVRDYWKQYHIRVSPKWAWFYVSCNNNFDPRYIPHTLYYTRIDQYFNSRKLGYGFNDKNYYSRIFSPIKQPETIVRNIGGIINDSSYSLISTKEAISTIVQYDEVICKPSQESGSGRGIYFWTPKNDSEIIESFINNKSNKNYIIQNVLKQHPLLSRFNPSSLNTFRVCSLLTSNGVVVLSTCLRMGVGNNRVDNHHAGGISCGVNNDGTLQKYAYSLDGKRYERHPNGVVFEHYKIPSYDKILQLVKDAHPIIGNFKLVGWDIAVDQSGDPVLIECNMRKNGIELHQFSNGPLFGDLTDIVLNDVFGC